jgi:hypothetical protein
MDDIIYFLLLVGWLAFSFYQQNAKKKKKLEQMRAEEARRQPGIDEFQSEDSYLESQHETMQQADAEPKPDFKSTIEEWLLGEQLSMKRPNDTEAQSLETIPEESEIEKRYDGFSDDKKPNVYQKYYDEEIAELAAADFNPDHEKIEDKLVELEEAMVLEEGDSLEDAVAEQQTNFDLRKAVIYSEILNRRY